MVAWRAAAGEPPEELDPDAVRPVRLSSAELNQGRRASRLGLAMLGTERRTEAI
jgi:hypothetical protein